MQRLWAFEILFLKLPRFFLTQTCTVSWAAPTIQRTAERPVRWGEIGTWVAWSKMLLPSQTFLQCFWSDRATVPASKSPPPSSAWSASNSTVKSKYWMATFHFVLFLFMTFLHNEPLSTLSNERSFSLFLSDVFPYWKDKNQFVLINENYQRNCIADSFKPPGSPFFPRIFRSLKFLPTKYKKINIIKDFKSDLMTFLSC